MLAVVEELHTDTDDSTESDDEDDTGSESGESVHQRALSDVQALGRDATAIADADDALREAIFQQRENPVPRPQAEERA